MSTITRLHDINPEARERLLARIPEAPADFDKSTMLDELPDILEAALDFILDDIEVLPGMTTHSAIGCRIIAATISRLRT